MLSMDFSIISNEGGLPPPTLMGVAKKVEGLSVGCAGGGFGAATLLGLATFEWIMSAFGGSVDGRRSGTTVALAFGIAPALLPSLLPCRAHGSHMGRLQLQERGSASGSWKRKVICGRRLDGLGHEP